MTEIFQNIIIIPYRDRESHIDYFIKNSVPLIEKYMPRTKIVVIEQEEGKLFNRGSLLNIGFSLYKNKTVYFITHDVDINPTEEVVKSIYTKKDFDVYRIKWAHGTSLGGIIKVKHDIIFNINGFPNNIWGWGIEDRALYYRCIIKNINITNNNNFSFNILPHKSNSVPYIGEKKTISDMWHLNYLDKLNNQQKQEMIMNSGLNNLEFKILETKKLHSIVELVKVSI